MCLVKVYLRNNKEFHCTLNFDQINVQVKIRLFTSLQTQGPEEFQEE